MLDFLNPTSENFILSKIIEFIQTIISFINPLDENFFGYKLIDMFSDLLKSLFIPDEERITAITNIFSEKFAFIESFKTAFEAEKNVINNLGNAPTLDIPVGSTKYNEKGTITIDFSWYASVRTFPDLVITGFAYAFFVWRMFISLPNTLHGDGGHILSDYIVYREEKK